jgi:threonine dehydrogenase-like Zn-dependent dehydrogenase
MLALRKTKPAPGLTLQDIPEPGEPGQGEVLLEVAAAGVCGSDLHLEDWQSSYEFMTSSMPVTLGHEFSGRVRAVGADVQGLQIGQLVAVYPVVSCRGCANCLRGDPALCLRRRALGVTLDGAFARYVRVPAGNCIPLPAHLDPALGALLEPLCIGDHANILGEVGFGDTVVVLGPGTIGQAAARVARWRGASRVVVVGLNDGSRLATARAVGATHTIDLAETPDLIAQFRTCTGIDAADVVIEATGHPSSVTDGQRLLKKGGVLVVSGIHAAPGSIDLVALVRQRQQIRGAHSSLRSSWDLIAQRVADDPESVRAMVSLQLPLAEAHEGFALCRQRGVSKVILNP